MKVHVLIWSVCLAIVFVLSGGHLNLGFAGEIGALLLGAAWAGITFGAVSDALLWKQHRRLAPHNPLEAIWTSIQLAMTSILIAYTFQSAAADAGFTIPGGLALLTPIACVLVWFATVFWSGPSRGFRVVPRRFRLRELIMVLVFGILVGLGASVAVTAFTHLLLHAAF